MRDQSIMQECSAVTASEMSSISPQQKSILRKRTTSEGDALKARKNDDDIAGLLGGGWKSLGLDFDDDDAAPSVMSCQVAVAKGFDKSAANDINAFKKLAPKKVDKKKFGGGPCLFGQGKVPVPPAASTENGPLSNVRVNMADPSSLLKDSAGAKPAPTGPPKQLPMPPLLKKKDSNPMGALNNALTRAISQPGSRAASRPESPSRMLSLPPGSPQQCAGTSNLLSMAAQDLKSSITAESSSAHHQYDGFEGIATTAMSQIVQNTITMQNCAGPQQSSTWGFPSATVSSTVESSTNGQSAKSQQTSGAFKPIHKSKSISNLNIECALEINDPKPMEKPQSTSFKPLEPSHQTHNSPIKVPKPVSPNTESVKPRFSNKDVPPIEARGSVLAPPKDSAKSEQVGEKKRDYSYYLNLINDEGDDVKAPQTKEVKEVKQDLAKPAKQVSIGYAIAEETASMNTVMQTKSLFENSDVTKQQAASMSKFSGNLSNGSAMQKNVKNAPNEPKRGEKENAVSTSKLKIQMGHDLASLLAKDEIQSSILVSPEVLDQNEELVVKESLVQNVKATSAKWSQSLKRDETIITFDGGLNRSNQKHQITNGKSHVMMSNASHSMASPSGTVKPTANNTSASKPSNMGNLSHYSGNPEQLLMKEMGISESTAKKQMQHQVIQSHQASMMQTESYHTSTEVLEHQKRIEIERQKQVEYETNQRRVVIEKDAQRNLMPKQDDNNELTIQLERRRSMEAQQAEQQEEERRRLAAQQQRLQEEERKKMEMERQRQIREAEHQQMMEQKKQEEARKKAELEKQKVIEMQRREEERRRMEAEKQRLLEIQMQEERRKVVAEKQRLLEIQRKEEERRRVEVEKQRLLEIQRQEEERRKAEAEKQRLLEIQRKEEERRKAEAEKQRLLEIQRQEEERRKAEAEQQRLLEIQRKEQEQRKAEAEKQRLLEIQRQEDERRRAEEERLRLLEIQRQQEEQRKAEEERLRQLEIQRQQEEERLRLEAERARQEEEKRMRVEQQRIEVEKQRAEELKRKQIEEMELKRKQEEEMRLQLEQKSILEMQTLHLSIHGDSYLEEKEKRQRIHDEQLRLLRQKQEEEQKRLLMLHQQEEALWESKRNFGIGSSLLDATQTLVTATNSDLEAGKMITVQSVEVRESQMHPSDAGMEEEEMMEMAPVTSQALDDEIIEYSAPIIRDGSRPSSVQSANIPFYDSTVQIPAEPISTSAPAADNAPSPVPIPPPRRAPAPAASPAAAPAPSPVPIPPPIPANLPAALNRSKIETPVTKNNIVDDPLSFLLSDSPVSACSSLSSAAPTPSPVETPGFPSAPLAPPPQPSYASLAKGEAIAELKSSFYDPEPPCPPPHVIAAAAAAAATATTSHNPPSKMHPPSDGQRERTKHSSRPEEVSPEKQRKQLMAQCMSEVAGMKDRSVLPSKVKSARKKTTKSRVERFIEATCGEPQTVVRKTASGKEYIEVISPEETARSLLEPPASR